MDADIARWLLDFIIRQPRLEDRMINSVIRVLPLEGADSSLKLGFLLRKIESEASNGVLSEEILEFLEQIEELEHREGIETLESMKKAYCAVAVECTFRFIEGGDFDKEEEYFDSVKRIWRGRVSQMEKFEMGVGLISEGLKEWRDKIEAGVWDSSSCEDVLVRSRGMNALEAVQQYIYEARERMGPSFLEVLAETLMSDDTVRDALGWGFDEVCDQGRESASCVPNAGKDVVMDGVCDQGRESASCVPNAGKDVIMDGVCDKGIVSAPRVPNDGEDVVTDGVRDQCRESVPRVPNDGEDVVTDGVRDQGRESVPSVPNDGEDVVTSKGDKEICKGHVFPSRKHVSIGRRRIPASITSRGVKIVDTEDLECESHDRYRCVPSPETNRVLESLKFSSLELKAVVRDPLPDALRLAEALRSDMARGNVVHEHVVGNTIRPDDVGPSPAADRSTDDFQANEGNHGNCILENINVPKPSLMARNGTAHVIEWDSVDDSAEASPKRPHLPSPEQRVISPLKKYEIAKLGRRRRPKRWSTLEEDTLRTGVQKYGAGQWKLILSMYRDIFEERTEVDLKDKWRNLIRC